MFKKQDRKFVQEKRRRGGGGEGRGVVVMGGGGAERVVVVGIIPLLLDLANTSSVFPSTLRAQTQHGLLCEDVDFNSVVFLM